ncbi:MAG: hypothetical protein D6714_13625 [Bacteroidetes bacterium]|nr:MAG: hypothetical protein D6714_13625 [Bacteroidota bacterium]
MKFVKIVLGLVALLVVLVLLVGLIQPKDFHFESSTEIDAPPGVVFAKVNDLKSWESWGPWMADTTIQVSYGEKTEGLDASYSWTSENQGKGTLKIIEAVPGESLKTEINFDEQQPANGFWKFEPTENNGTKVTWGLDFSVPWPFNAFMILNNEEQTTQMFSTGLSNLKTVIETEEKNKTYRGFKVSLIDFPAKNYLIIRDKVSFDKIADFYAQNFPKLAGALASAKLEMDGMPSGFYYEYDEENQVTDMAAAIAYKGDSPTDQFANVSVGPAKALAIDYYGDYNGVGEAHYAMDEYMQAHGIAGQKLVIEEYVTDPGSEPDTSKWLTRVFYLLEE